MVLEAPAAPAEAAPETASVPTASVAAGDVLRVLPGERMPVRPDAPDILLQLLSHIHTDHLEHA
jgi:hypothetical protein